MAPQGINNNDVPTAIESRDRRRVNHARGNKMAIWVVLAVAANRCTSAAGSIAIQDGRAPAAAVIAIKHAFNWAEGEGLLVINPLRKVKKPPQTIRERVFSRKDR